MLKLSTTASAIFELYLQQALGVKHKSSGLSTASYRSATTASCCTVCATASRRQHLYVHRCSPQSCFTFPSGFLSKIIEQELVLCAKPLRLTAGSLLIRVDHSLHGNVSVSCPSDVTGAARQNPSQVFLPSACASVNETKIALYTTGSRILQATLFRAQTAAVIFVIVMVVTIRSAGYHIQQQREYALVA